MYLVLLAVVLGWRLLWVRLCGFCLIMLFVCCFGLVIRLLVSLCWGIRSELVWGAVWVLLLWLGWLCFLSIWCSVWSCGCWELSWVLDLGLLLLFNAVGWVGCFMILGLICLWFIVFKIVSLLVLVIWLRGSC